MTIDATPSHSTPPEAPNDSRWTSRNSTEEMNFKGVSKWKLLRSMFNCTRVWRDAGRARNLRVHCTVGLKLTSIDLTNQGFASEPEPAGTRNSLPTVKQQLKEGASKPDPSQGCNSMFGESQNAKERPFPLVVFVRGQSVFGVTASAVVLLSFEWDQSATDPVDWGGCDLRLHVLAGSSVESNKRCGSIVTLFQAASMLLFQAAYFWLKFREAVCGSERSGLKRKLSEEGNFDECLKGVYKRSGNKGFKYEPRFRPRREWNGPTVQTFNNLPLGSYSNAHDAQIVRHIAAFYYGVGADTLPLRHGGLFQIPAMTEACLSGHAKIKWVADKAKEVFKLYCRQNDATPCSAPDGCGDKDVNERGAATKVADPSHSRSLNSNLTFPPPTESKDVQAQLSPNQQSSEFLVEPNHQPPELDAVNSSHLKTDSDQSLQPMDQFQCSEMFQHEVVGAAVEGNPGQILTDFNAWNGPDGASSPPLTNFCSNDFGTRDLLLEVVSSQQRQLRAQQQQINALQRELEQERLDRAFLVNCWLQS